VLETRFKPVLLKRKGVVLGVWGEAGIGKSYRVAELLRSLPCQTLSLHATTPLSTLATTLVKPKKLASWAERTLTRLAKNESVEAANVLDAFGATLAALAPFVLHLEDLHEADNERLEFIQKLAQMIQRTKGVGLIITSRIEPPTPFEKFRPEPLTKEESDSLLGREVAAPLPKDALEFIYRKASGNPLYTLEYLRFLSRQGFLWSDGKAWHWRKPEGRVMPVTVEALIELALSKITEERLETALQAKAYLPLETSDALWQRVADLSTAELAGAKLDLERQGVFSKGRFAHPLYREVTLKALSQEKRQRLARRTLEVLRDSPREAAPFVADAHLQDREALELLQCAVQEAKAENNQSATGQLLALAARYAAGEEKGSLALAAARALSAYNVAEAERLFEMAAGQPSVRIEALSQLAELLAGQGRVEEAERTLLQIDESRSSRPYLVRLLRLHGAAKNHQEILELIRRHPELLENPEPLTASYAGKALALNGFPDEAEALARTVLRQADLSGETRAALYKVLSSVCYVRGDHAGMERYEAEVLALAKQSGNLRLQDEALFNRAMALENLNRYEEEKEVLEQDLQLCLELGDSMARVVSQTFYAHVLTEFGTYQQAEDLLLEARSYLERTDFAGYRAECACNLSKLYLDWQPPHGTILALRHSHSALEIARNLQLPLVLVRSLHVAALAEAWAGNVGPAKALAQETLYVVQNTPLPMMLDEAYLALGYAAKAAGDRNSAVTAFQEAQRHTGGLAVQKIGLELDRLNNDIDSARKRMHWFEERGLLNGVTIAKRYFPELVEHPIQEVIPVKDAPRLEVLGVMQVHHEGQTAAVRGRKRQELFLLLLEARMSGRGEVSRLDLFDALYPKTDEDKALGNLKQLVHSLRLELGESVIKTTTGGYALGEMTSDAETFLQTGDTTLWRGGYEVSGETVAESLYLFLFDKAKVLLENDPKETARVAKFLLEYDPYNLPYLRLSLQALQRSNNYRSLGRVYEEAKTHFAEIGEELPQTWTEFLRLQINA
jgi:hypothetical protein